MIEFNKAVIIGNKLLDFTDLPVIRLSVQMADELFGRDRAFLAGALDLVQPILKPCLLYTSDAADE